MAKLLVPWISLLEPAFRLKKPPTFTFSEVKKIVDVLNKQEYEVEEDKNERNWQMVSRVFDRLCMILFFVVCGVLIAYNIIDLYLRFSEADNDDDFEKI